MGRKIVKAMSVLQIVLCFVAYISMSIHFNRDPIVFKMLENTDTLGTALRLALYAVPGIHLLSGLYGLVFTNKKALILINIVEIANCAITFSFIGKSVYMRVLSIVSICIAVVYFIATIASKEN